MSLFKTRTEIHGLTTLYILKHFVNRYGSDNPVFGLTRNATNPKLSPGGSSSGTGSLVGANGAMFGTGTDIGGSLRIPAHFNGVAAIKPSSGRLRLANTKKIYSSEE